MALRLNGSTSGYVEIDAPAVAGDNTLTLPSTPNGSLVALDSSGRLGIGTNSPSNLLHIAGTGTDLTGLRIVNTQHQAAATSTAGLKLGITNSAGQRNCRIQAREEAVDSNAIALDFFTNSADAVDGETVKMTVLHSGNVGIGTSVPTQLLELNGASNPCLLIKDTTNNVIAYTFADDSVANFGSASAHPVVFRINNNEAARIDSNGRLLVGTSSARSLGFSCQTQIEGVTNATSSLSIVNNQNSAEPAYLVFGKSRAGSIGGATSVSNGDYIGIIRFAAADGTDTNSFAAEIGCNIDGTPGSNDTPGRLVFSTTADGASAPTDRLRIRANGNTEPGADNTYTIGTSASRWGSVWAANGTIQTSDERTKTQIANAHLGFEFIKSLRPVSYRWIEGGKRETGERNEDGTAIYESVPGERTHYGFIAQEVKEAVDAAGVDFGGWLLSDKDDPDSQQALRYDQFIAPLTKALQEAIAKIESLEANTAALEARITALEVTP
jgi:hypothetical protein